MGLLYTRFKIFRYKKKLDSLPPEKATLAPVHIRIKPTNACNHRCWYCAYRADNLQLGRDMAARDSIPRAKMREITRDIIAMGVKAVTFSGGGEPFCYPHLPETVRALAESKTQFAALTNGSLLDGELAELFAFKGRWLRVSMDGWSDASYSEFRGARSGEFSRIIANLTRFKALGGACRLGASIIVNNRNAGRIRELISTLCGVGVDSIKVSPCIVSNKGAENLGYHRESLAAARGQIDRALEECARRNIEVSDSYGELGGKFEKAYTWCPYLQILPVIGADLNVYACPDKAYNLAEGCLGSLAKTSFRELWFSDRKRFFKIDPSRVCNHHCLANDKNKMILEYLYADPKHLGFV
ncbi:MAG: radical SAM protein [Elusimicrobia bacterium]|nr:radical SAM protein [Elusimicrobiota bacterium]